MFFFHVRPVPPLGSPGMLFGSLNLNVDMHKDYV